MPTESPHSAAVTLGWWQRGPDTEYTAAFTDPKPPTLSVCPQCHRSPSVSGILGRFLQAAASRHAGSQEFLVQCCRHPASPGHPVTTITHPASLRQRVSSCCCSPPAPTTRTQARGDQRIDTAILLMQLLLKCSFKVTWNGQREIRDGFELCNVTMWHLCPQHPPAPTGPLPGLRLLLQPLTVPSQGTCRMGHPKGLFWGQKRDRASHPVPDDPTCLQNSQKRAAQAAGCSLSPHTRASTDTDSGAPKDLVGLCLHAM